MLSRLSPLLYVKISPERLTVRDVKTGIEKAEVPQIAIGRQAGKATVLAVGNQARAAAMSQAAEVLNPFGHPRTLVGDFTAGEQLLKAFLKEFMGTRFLPVAPRVLMHPLGNPEGGFTQIERRALREMALGAGASQVYLWVGREFSDAEILAPQFLSSPELQG